MRQPEVSDDEIIAAGERLQGQGKRLTGWALRTALGGRGNPKRLFDVWQCQIAKDKPEGQAEVIALPPSVQEMADAALAQISIALGKSWLAIYGEVDAVVSSRYLAERQQLEETRAVYEEEMAGANTAIEAADQREAELQDLLANQQSLMAASNIEQARLEERLRIALEREATMTGRLQELESRLSEAQAEAIRSGERLHVVDAECVALRERLEAAQSKSTHAQLAASAHEATAKAAKADAVETRQANQRLVGELAATRTRLDEVVGQAASEREICDALRHELEQERDRAQALTAAMERERTLRLEADAQSTSAFECAVAAESKQEAVSRPSRAVSNRPSSRRGTA